MFRWITKAYKSQEDSTADETQGEVLLWRLQTSDHVSIADDPQGGGRLKPKQFKKSYMYYK